MKGLYILLAVAVVAIPVTAPGAASAQYSATYSQDASPPISQPLVREGSFAVKLVEALGMGTVSDEAQAESMLVSVGIAPRNGWVADYPVTPDIIGELQSSVSDAADAGQLPVGKSEALKAFQNVLVAYGLSVSPPAVAQAGDNVQSYTPDSTIIEDYYYDYGPPVVTYYAPPPDYYYLYSWVPYPFWWWGFWFPGFFVLADFDIYIGGHYDHHGGHHDGYYDGHGGHDGDKGHDGNHGGHREFVTNHYRDPGTGRTVRIDPANRANGGAFADRGNSGWTTASARNSAQAIYNNRAGRAPGRGVIQSSGGRSASGPAGQTGSVASRSGSRGSFSSSTSAKTYGNQAYRRNGYAGSSARSYSSPYVGSRSYSGSRSFNSPSAVSRRSYAVPSGGRTFRSSPGGIGTRAYAPSVGGRSYSAPTRSRSFSASSGGRTFGSPSVGSRSFSAPSAGRSFGGSNGMARSFGGGHAGSFGGFRGR